MSAGSNQLFTVCQKSTGGIVNMWSRQMNEMFVPTSYGLISDAGSGEGAIRPGDAVWSEFDDGPAVQSAPVQSMTAEEIAAEQTAAIATDLARLQAELDAIRAQAAVYIAETSNQP